MISRSAKYYLFFAAHILCQMVSPPAQGLGSNSNYYFVDANAGNLEGFTVNLEIVNDFEVSATGASFQLNCVSVSTGSDAPNFQQFVIEYDGTSGLVTAAINNFLGTQELFFQSVDIGQTNGANVLPTNSRLGIAVITDTSGAATGASFSASSAGLIKDAGAEISITNGELRPLVGCTLNIVGDGNGRDGNFVKGVGTMDYSATNPIRPVNTTPAGVEFGTAETGNSIYTPMEDVALTTLTQSFETE
jgi:hypothetical protein